MVLNYDAYVSIFMVVIILISLGVIIRVACKSKKEETTSATRTMTHQTEHASDVLSHLDFLDYCKLIILIYMNRCLQRNQIK